MQWHSLLSQIIVANHLGAGCIWCRSALHAAGSSTSGTLVVGGSAGAGARAGVAGAGATLQAAYQSYGIQVMLALFCFAAVKEGYNTRALSAMQEAELLIGRG